MTTACARRRDGRTMAGVGFAVGRRPRGRALVVGAVAVAAATVGVGVAADDAVSGDVSRCERFAAQSSARERAVTGSGERVVVIGDSYSAGLGLDDPRTSWPVRLPGEVHVHGFSGSGFAAGSGRCRGVSYADRAARAVGRGAATVVLQGGLNDVRQPAEEIREGLDRALGRLALAAPGAEVVVVGPPPAPSRADGAVRVDSVLAAAAAAAGVRYVSLVDARLGYLPDDLHLTPDGHDAFGDAVASALG